MVRICSIAFAIFVHIYFLLNIDVELLTVSQSLVFGVTIAALRNHQFTDLGEIKFTNIVCEAFFSVFSIESLVGIWRAFEELVAAIDFEAVFGPHHGTVLYAITYSAAMAMYLTIASFT